MLAKYVYVRKQKRDAQRHLLMWWLGANIQLNSVHILVLALLCTITISFGQSTYLQLFDWGVAQPGGSGGIRTHGPFRIKRFRVVLVIATSIRFHIIASPYSVVWLVVIVGCFCFESALAYALIHLYAKQLSRAHCYC